MTIAFPSIGVPSRLSWRLISNTQSSISPLSKSAQTYELPGARWAFTAEWPPLQSEERRLMRAFLAELGGQAGRFTVHNWEQPTIAGSGSAGSPSPAVNAGGQTGNSLATKNWTPSSTGLLLPGDYFGVNGELKIVTASVSSDTGGLATISFRPPLRSSPAAGAALDLTRPETEFMLTDSTVEWAVGEGNLFAEFVIDAIEAF